MIPFIYQSHSPQSLYPEHGIAPGTYFNILFLWDCASKITTREQMTKDRLALKRIDDEERKKKEKRDKKASLSKNSSGK